MVIWWAESGPDPINEHQNLSLVVVGKYKSKFSHSMVRTGIEHTDHTSESPITAEMIRLCQNGEQGLRGAVQYTLGVESFKVAKGWKWPIW